MSKTSLYNWQKFIHDIDEHTGEKQPLLLEMKEPYINAIKNEIEIAESGENADVMPFNDIFGSPTPDDPKTRMLMPYGDPDMGKFTYYLAFLSDKQRNKLGIDNVRYSYWEAKKVRTQQKVKPPGYSKDPTLPLITKEKETVDLKFFVEYEVKTPSGEVKIKQQEFAFFPLLQKFAPDQTDWWQKRQTYFFNNYFATESAVQKANSTKLVELEKLRDSGVQQVVILSRHPIDVLRMSDFDLLHSCHAQGREYFRCAMDESKRTSKGGGVVYMVDKKRFDQLYPDGKIPQKGEIFADKQRKVSDDDKFSEPFARLRVRWVRDQSKEIDYAVPDNKIYGLLSNSFKQETLDFFAKNQVDKFAKDNEIIVPESLTRFGGEYEDPHEDKVGNNFARLIKLSLEKYSGIPLEKIEKDEELSQLLDTLKYSSIGWGGTEFCSEFADEVNIMLDKYRNKLDYISLYDPQQYCEEDSQTGVVYEINATVSVEIPFSNFADLDEEYPTETIRKKLIKHDYDQAYYGSNALTWPNLKFNRTAINVQRVDYNVGSEQHDAIRITFSYYLEDAIGLEQFESYLRDLVDFERNMSLEDYTNEVEAILSNLGLFAESAYSQLKEDIDELYDLVDEESETFSIHEDTNKKTVFSHEKVLLVKQKNEFKLPPQSTTLSAPLSPAEFFAYEFPKISSQISYDARKKFRQLFEDRAKKAIEQIQKQLPLFRTMQPEVEAKYLVPKLYFVNFNAQIEAGSFSFSEVIEITYYFDITLDKTLTKLEILTSIQFIKEIIKNVEIIDELAHQALYSSIQQYLIESKKHASKPNGNKLLTEEAKRKLMGWKNLKRKLK